MRANLHPDVRCATIVILSTLWLASGCQPRVAPSVDSPAPPRSSFVSLDCDSFGGTPQPGSRIVVALTEKVDPAHAPHAHNVSERLVFRNLYQTLVHLDCEGVLRPGLAAEWRSHQDGRVWVFTLRNDARFWDGTALRADDVKTCWIDAQQCARSDCSVSPWLWLQARAESVKAMDERRLAITLPEPQADFPLLLAHLDFAVALRREGEAWPLGTGPYRLPSETTTDRELRFSPNPWIRGATSRNELVFRLAPGVDPRDLERSDWDALLVRRKDVLDFFRALPDVTVTALLFDRIYALVLPPIASDSSPPRASWLRDWTREELAMNVAASVARPAEHLLFNPTAAPSCQQLFGPTTRLGFGPLSAAPTLGPDPHQVIVYPAEDEDARRLAERLTALATSSQLAPRHRRGELPPVNAPPEPALPRSVPLSARTFAATLKSAAAGAYLLPLTRCFPTACLQLAALLSRALWLQDVGVAPLLSRGGRAQDQAKEANPGIQDIDVEVVARALQQNQTVIPLIMTRPHLVSQGRLAGVRFSYDGTLLLDRAGWLVAKEPPP